MLYINDSTLSVPTIINHNRITSFDAVLPLASNRSGGRTRPTPTLAVIEYNPDPAQAEVGVNY